MVIEKAPLFGQDLRAVDAQKVTIGTLVRGAR